VRGWWLALAVAAAGCGRGRPEGEIEFWHTQADRNGQALEAIVRDYNARGPRMKVRLLYVGGYDGLYRKLLSAIRADRLPDMAVSYESMVAEYEKFGVVADLDPYLNDPAHGLAAADRQDIFPAFLESNRFPQFGGRMLSFPFTKSLLMLYWNAGMLKEAGFDRPPATWAEFLAQCRAVRAKRKIVPYALSIDPSTIDGMVMGLGGKLLSPDLRRTLFDAPEGVRVFQILDELVRNGLARQVSYRTYDDRNDFAAQRAAFFMRSSTSRPYLQKMVKRRFAWDMAVPPCGEGRPPMTVLFGANICVFRTTPERQRAAWEFIKFFAARETTARWATATGYLPLRRSAAETGRMRRFFAAHPANRRAFDAIPVARAEPNVAGWQKVRDALKDAEMAVVAGRTAPEAAARALAERATDCVAGGRAREAPPPAGAFMLRGAALALLVVAVFRVCRARVV
jgi:ABC-type glycerol-3-phosphate transport system substrate-binding protein